MYKCDGHSNRDISNYQKKPATSTTMAGFYIAAVFLASLAMVAAQNLGTGTSNPVNPYFFGRYPNYQYPYPGYNSPPGYPGYPPGYPGYPPGYPIGNPINQVGNVPFNPVLNPLNPVANPFNPLGYPFYPSYPGYPVGIIPYRSGGNGNSPSPTQDGRVTGDGSTTMSVGNRPLDRLSLGYPNYNIPSGYLSYPGVQGSISSAPVQPVYPQGFQAPVPYFVGYLVYQYPGSAYYDPAAQG